MELFWAVVALGVVVAVVAYQGMTGFEKATAQKRSAHWKKHLEEIAANLPYPDAPFPLRHGEKYVLSLADQQLVEARRGTRVSSRRTDAFTLGLAKGFYYTAAAGKSVSPEPDDELRQIDTGVAHFTTHRVVFAGAKQTREWDYAKLLGITEQSGGLRLMISVSNRQKTSGLQQESLTQIAPGLAYQIAENVKDHGFDHAKKAALFAAREVAAQMAIVEESTHVSEAIVEERMKDWHAKNPFEGDEADDAAPDDLEDNARPDEHQPLAEIQVVGETFYKKSFQALREELKTEGDSEHIMEVQLRNDPDNEYSLSGKAVAVYIRDKQVGHVPEWLAPKVFDQLERTNGSVILGARLYLDFSDAKPQKNAVTVILDSRLVVV